MDNVRVYGVAPFNVVVVHGGPGAGGEMAPVARNLAPDFGVLEPIQTATSLEGQVEELKDILKHQSTGYVTLVGFSWGAWLSFIVAAQYPDLVKKLILVGSGPFESRYVPQLHETRVQRLSKEERCIFETLIKALEDPQAEKKDTMLAELGELASKTDTYDPIPDPQLDNDKVGPQGDVFQNVWHAASEWRRSGKLLALGRQIQCPVVAIHGDYDPHPADGVQNPLSAILKDFRFILLDHCGHTPWVERHAWVAFYETLTSELAA